MIRWANMLLPIILLSLICTGCSDDGGDDGSSSLKADAGPDHLRFFIEDEKERIEVEFDASNSTGDIQTYGWDFDRTGAFRQDAAGITVTHIYQESGRYSVTLKVEDKKEEDFDITEVFINYGQYENSSLGDGESEEYSFPVKMPATRVYGEIRYDPGGFFGNNLTLRFTDDEGNSTDREGTNKGEREEGGKVVKWVEIKGEFVLQYEMGTWEAHVERHDSSGGDEDYSLFIEVDYDPESGI